MTKPLGIYLTHVLDSHGRPFSIPCSDHSERLTYKLLGVNPDQEHDWKQYTAAMLIFSLVTMLFTYMIPAAPGRSASKSAEDGRAERAPFL
jgi:K+-transporting ATPase ATPase A chain